MKECSKATSRRLHDTAYAMRYFIGQGLDIGGAADPLAQFRELFPAIRAIRTWGTADGDPQFLAGLTENSFDFVHASHLLAAMEDPREALRHWFRVLRPGGHLILTVPDEDMYEQGIFPSTFNSTHRWTFTVWKPRSWSPASLNLTDLIQVLGAQADVKRLGQIDQGYRFGLPRFDQTLTPVAEAAIEMIVRKRPMEEAVAAGRAPGKGQLSLQDVTVLTGLTPRPPQATSE